VKAWHEDRVNRGLTSARDSLAHWETHISKVLGMKRSTEWTRDDFRAVSASLDDKIKARTLSWKTATNVWGIATKMADDARNSKRSAVRCRDDNPAEGVRGPDRGERTARQYLYPSEFLKFLQCETVPMAWRRLVAVAIYSYARAGELRALTWDDVDVDRGIITITKSIEAATGRVKSTKSKAPRMLPIEPALLPLLVAMKEESGGTGYVVELPGDGHAARGLRSWLEEAGIERRGLFAQGPSVRRIRFHDMRASGITWMAVRGDDPMKIQTRAGHTDFKVTQSYVREAEVLRQGFGEPFPAIPDSLIDSNRSEQSFKGSKLGAQKRKRPSISAWPLVAREGFEPTTFGL